MRWSSAVSDISSLTRAVDDTAERVEIGLDGPSADLVFAFISSHHAPSYYSVVELVRSRFPGATVIGCSAGGVIGAGHEVEKTPGVALTAASLPGVVITPFEFESEELPSPDAAPAAWEALIGVPASDNPSIVLLPDPFTLPSDALVEGLDYAYPNSVKIGGLASGGTVTGANALFSDRGTRRSGAVGVALSGNVVVDSVVAQGCRPIGEPMVVTGCRENVITELSGELPLDVLRGLFDGGDERERRLIRRSLQIGVLMDPFQDQYEAGDFLIRNVIGADGDNGALAVGEKVREGQVVQFHVRDANSASDDLGANLMRYLSDHPEASPSGALLFTCLGRGERLFGRVDHDTDLFQSVVGQMPVTGFFCNGEIGPIGGSTFLHGYTSSFALFRPKEPAAI
ncbi:MAG: FIST N-terminal domain-containing protein [Dehalococcoidia bacterium]|nr:FIST N-terminal domain-containing protein [Dehalococcoidia bacterium]